MQCNILWNREVVLCYKISKQVGFTQSHTCVLKASGCMRSCGLARVAHVRHLRQKGLSCQALSVFSKLLMMSGDKLHFIRVFYAFRIQGLCYKSHFASGFFLF